MTIKEVEDAIESALQSLQKELSKLRTGRASLNMLDGVRVDNYGTPSPINPGCRCSHPGTTTNCDPTLGQDHVTKC